jgi:hypothetical protein
MSLKPYAVVSTIVVIALIILFRPVSAYSQETCLVLKTGQGWGAVTLTVPSWVRRIEGTATWDGLQLRVYLDGTVYAIAMFNDPYFSTPYSSQGFAPTYQLEFGGIMVNFIGQWEVRGCSDVPPTPTPSPFPTPTRTPIPWPTTVVLIPECTTSDPVALIGVGEEYLAEGSSVVIYPDEGATGDPGTIYEVLNPGQSVGIRYTGTMTLPLLSRALIRVVDGTGYGIPMIWVKVTTCTLGTALQPTPMALSPEDVKPVVVGAEYVGTTCYTIMPSVSVTIPIPWGDPIDYAYDGFGVCLRKHNLSLRWGDWDVIAIIFPLFAFAFLWVLFYLFRRG